MQKKIVSILLAVLMTGMLAAGTLRAQGAAIPHIDADAFAAMIAQPQKPVLIQFDAEWCPYCKGLQPALQKLAARKASKLSVFRIDTDVETDLTLQYQIQTLPTLVIFSDGQELARNAGAPKEKELFEWVESVIGK